MTFLSHTKQWSFIKYMAIKNKLPHALLFSGPDRIGKKVVAIELAKLLHCPYKIPCQECLNCQNIEKRTHPDIRSIYPTSNQIKISQIRELINFLSLAPSSDSYKIAIIDEAHLLTLAAQHSFLKLLEEPKGKCLIVLITSKSNLLLPTVLSRVWKIKFFNPSRAELVGFIKNKISRNFDWDIDHIINLSSQKPGLLIDILKNSHKLEALQKDLEELGKLTKASIGYRLIWAHNISENRFLDILELWLRVFRGIMILKLRLGGSKVIVHNFPDYSFEDLRRIIKKLEEVYFAIFNYNVNPRLAIDVLLLNL